MKFFIASLFLCIVSFSISATLFAVGGTASLVSKFNSINGNWFNIGDEYKGSFLEETYEFSEEVKEIDIEISYAEVKIKKHNKNNIKVFSKIAESRRLEVEVKESKLIISESEKKDVEKIESYKGQILEVFLPEGLVTNLKVEAGAMSFKSKDLNFNSIQLEVGAGDIDFENIKCKDFKIEAAAGDISLKNFVTNLGSIEAAAGNVEIENMLSEGLLSIEALAGNVEIDMNMQAPQVHVEALAGNIEFTLTDDIRPNFTLKVDKNTMNQIDIDENPTKISNKEYKYGEGKGLVKLNARLGNIEVL